MYIFGRSNYSNFGMSYCYELLDLMIVILKKKD